MTVEVHNDLNHHVYMAFDGVEITEGCRGFSYCGNLGGFEKVYIDVGSDFVECAMESLKSQKVGILKLAVGGGRNFHEMYEKTVKVKAVTVESIVSGSPISLSVLFEEVKPKGEKNNVQ